FPLLVTSERGRPLPAVGTGDQFAAAGIGIQSAGDRGASERLFRLRSQRIRGHAGSFLLGPLVESAEREPAVKLGLQGVEHVATDDRLCLQIARRAAERVVLLGRLLWWLRHGGSLVHLRLRTAESRLPRR